MTNLESAIEFIASLQASLSTALEAEQKKTGLVKEVAVLEKTKERLAKEIDQAKADLEAAKAAEKASIEKNAEAEAYRNSERNRIVSIATKRAAELVADAENRLRAAKLNEDESEAKLAGLAKEIDAAESKLAQLKVAHENFKRVVGV